jgi:hypothetical protein
LTALLVGGTQFSPPRSVAASRFTPSLRGDRVLVGFKEDEWAKLF